MSALIADLIKHNLVYPKPTSTWASAPLLIPKPGPDAWHFTVDLHPINQLIMLHQFPTSVTEHEPSKLKTHAFMHTPTSSTVIGSHSSTKTPSNPRQSSHMMVYSAQCASHMESATLWHTCRSLSPTLFLIRSSLTSYYGSTTACCTVHLSGTLFDAFACFSTTESNSTESYTFPSAYFCNFSLLMWSFDVTE